MLSESNALQELITKFVSGVPNFVMAVVVALVGIIVSKIVSKIVKKFLIKIKIDKLGDKLNEIEFIEKSNFTIKLSTVFSKVVYYFLVLFFLVAASDVLKMPAVSNLVIGIFNLIPHLIVAGIILILGTLLADAIRGISQTGMESLGIPSARMIANFVFYFLFINVVISAMTQAKINTEFLAQNISLIIGGLVLAVAIGYGLASKESMANFLASYYSRGKFEVGDTITIDDTTGRVVSMDKSCVTIVNEAGHKVIFPLSKISQSKIEIHNN
ncbi:MAG: mechanosensitive ion channel [Saprospiraceae bacterium]|nr:mechanosensitive ion channel [Saprospiraceae bacterium]